jgi:hypothetical protein
MDSPINNQETGHSKKVFAEAILKHDSLLGVLMELEDTDAGQEVARGYFQRKGIDDPSSDGLLPLIQMKSGVLLMFPYVSYLHKLGDSHLHDPDFPDEWNAVLTNGKKDPRLAGTARAIAIVRHSIAHLLEGDNGKDSTGSQGVDFDKRSFHADIGSIEFKGDTGYLEFFAWLRKTARKRAHKELESIRLSAVEHQDLAGGPTDPR